MMFAQKIVATTATTRGGSGVSAVVATTSSSFSRMSSHYRGVAVVGRNRRRPRSFCCQRPTSTILSFYGRPNFKNSHSNHSVSTSSVHHNVRRCSNQIGTSNRIHGSFLSRRRHYATTVGTNETTTANTSSTTTAPAPPPPAASTITDGDDRCSTVIEAAAEEGCAATLKYTQKCNAGASSCSSSVTSIVTASEQLLHATNATNLLSEQILQIRNNNVRLNDNVNDLSNATTRRNSGQKKCMQELHRAFLSLVQSLLDIIDNTKEESNNKNEMEKDRNHPSSDDDEELRILLDLVVKLSYRAHQLQFWFHRPLYKRIAVTFANHQKKNQKHAQNTIAYGAEDSDNDNIVSTMQPRRSTVTTRRRSRKQKQHPKQQQQQQQQNTLNYVLRSRVDWIWTIYRWSNDAGKNIDNNFSAASNPNHHKQGQNFVSQHDIEWFFRDIFITLAWNGEWSDLSYMLQGTLLSSSFHRDQGRNNCEKKTSRMDSVLNDEGQRNKTLFLDEGLVLIILKSMQRLGIFPSIWKGNNVQNAENWTASGSAAVKQPSKINREAETDILGIMLLMEPSIWQIFDIEYDGGAYDSRNYETAENDDGDHDHLPETTTTTATNSLADDLSQKHQASLRDAIEALLETDSTSDIFNDGFDDDDDFEDLEDDQNGDDEDISKAKYSNALDDLLIDLLHDLNTTGNNDTAGVIVSISKLPDEVIGNNKGSGRNRILGNSSSRLKYKHVVGTTPVIRTGQEIPSWSTSSVKSTRGRQSSDEHDWEYLRDESPSDSSTGNSTFWSDESDEEMLLYSRKHHDDEIPDLCSFLYEHNGRRPLRYRPNLEREILDQIGQSYDDEDYEDEFMDGDD